MAELPKSVRARLTAQPASGRTEHPDSDLLTAFAERSLSGRERDRVMDHLAQCAICRDVVSTALPELDSPEASTLAPRSRWLSMPVLRWAAVAAAVVVVGSAALLYKPEQRQQAVTETQWQTATAPKPEQKAEAAPSEKLPQEGTKVAEPNANAPAKTPALTLGAGKRDELAKKPSSLPQSGPEQAAFSALSSGVREEAEIRHDADLKNQKDKFAYSREAAARQQAPGGQMRKGALQGTVPSPAAPARRVMTDQITAKDAAAAPPASNEVAGAAGDASQKTAQMYKAMPAPSADARPRSNPEAVTAGSAGLAGGAMAARPAAAARASWTITTDGKLQHSVNGGASWEPVFVSENTEFRAVTSIGPEVWAGGSGGALYHSTDNGERWIKVPLPTAAAIVRIEFSDPAHGSVTTSANQTWATPDAGLTWTLK